MFTEFIDAVDDIHSLKDDEWNRKVLEALKRDVLRTLLQLSRTIHQQIAPKGRHQADVVAFRYERQTKRFDRTSLPTKHCTELVALLSSPASNGMGDKEYDEDDVEVYHGEFTVLMPREENIFEVKHIDDNGPALRDPAEGTRSEYRLCAKTCRLYPHARRVVIFCTLLQPVLGSQEQMPFWRTDSGCEWRTI